MDGLLIYSATIEDNFDHLKKIIHALQTHEMSVSPKKCLSKSEKIELLRSVVWNRTWVDPSKVRAVQTWPKLN